MNTQISSSLRVLPGGGEKKKSDQPKGNVTLIASGKGGVGKTWLSATLGHALCQGQEKVLLFDADLGLANLDIQLGLTPKCDLSTVIAGKASFKEAIVTVPNTKGLAVLAGQSGGGSLASLGPAQLAYIRQSIGQLGQEYDHVLMDLGAGIGGTVRALSPVARHCIVVLTPEPTSLADAYAFLKVTRRHCPEMDLVVVVNQVDSKREGQQVFDTLSTVCQKFLGFQPKLLGFVRRDRHVSDAIRAQAPYLTQYPATPTADDVIELAATLGSLKKAA
ncbi:MAG: MinD/ParA family protein [bacterium]|nr:MinD/ParA family protein [bacterium]